MKQKLRLKDHDHQTVMVDNRALDTRVRCIFQTRNTTEATGYIIHQGVKIRVSTPNHHRGVWFEGGEV